jgi:hypothetical protein
MKEAGDAHRIGNLNGPDFSAQDSGRQWETSFRYEEPRLYQKPVPSTLPIKREAAITDIIKQTRS